MQQHQEQSPRRTERDECPLCGLRKPKGRRCCDECRAACEAVHISDKQAIEDARRIREWKVRR